MIRKCDICGFEFDDYWMHKYNAGRTQIWVCNKCKQNGIREVNLSAAMKKRPRKREKQEK